MKFPRLTDENFLMYAIKCYNNPNCLSSDDFKRDMKAFAYISKALSKIAMTQSPSAQNVRQLLNHIISLCNLFGNSQTARMMFFYYPEKHHPCIKTAMDFLGRLPDTKATVHPEIRDIEKIPWDEKMVKLLENFNAS
jgi:hypothetical protein